MREEMKKIVEQLRERISSNLEVIKSNELKIKQLLLEPVSPQRTELLSALFNTNRQLLEENHDSLNLQLKMINYIGKYSEQPKYHGVDDSNPESQLGPEETPSEGPPQTGHSQPETPSAEASAPIRPLTDLLLATIRGEIVFDSHHPRFDDMDFFNNLLDSYIKEENYEMCSYLMKVKGL